MNQPFHDGSTARASGRRRRIVVGGLLLNTFALVTVACGVSTGESSFQSIDGGEFVGINQSTTTSTTTTTTTTTTTMPESSDSSPDSTTTSTLAPQLETVTLYFIARGSLQPAQRMLVPEYTPNLLIAALEEGPEAGEFALESFVADGLIVGQPTLDRGVLGVELDATTYSRILGVRNKRQAIAQIVLTLTSNLVGVGQVAFFIDGEPEAVPSDRGIVELATSDDFKSLLSGSPIDAAEPSVTTTTTAPTEE